MKFRKFTRMMTKRFTTELLIEKLFIQYILLLITVFSIDVSSAAEPDSKSLSGCPNNSCFGVGEKLVFNLDYSFINAGRTVMSIDSVIEVAGKKCYKVVSKVSSNKTFDLIYKVRDYVETNVDVEGIFSRRYVKRLQEGGYNADKEIFYEQERGMAHTLNKGVYQNSYQIEPRAQDILSALFYIRTLELSVGDTININLFDVRKSYPLKISVNRREQIEVPAGKFDCLVVEPFLESEGMFRSKGRIEIWLTDDHRKIPALMRTYIMIVGHIDAKLAEYTPGIPYEAAGESADYLE